MLDEPEAIKMFIDLVGAGKCPDNSLTFTYIQRGYFDIISPNKYRFTIERHPHLFSRPSIGKPSSAFATVKRTYEIDTDLQKIDFIGEDVIDIIIDYYALADEDLDTLWNKDELYRLRSIKKVIEFAEDSFLLAEEVYVTDYELPSDFFEQLKQAWIEAVLGEWKRERSSLKLYLKSKSLTSKKKK